MAPIGSCTPASWGLDLALRDVIGNININEDPSRNDDEH